MSELQPLATDAVFPTIFYGNEYREHVASIGVDLVSVTEYLRARGMTDSQIEDLTIRFEMPSPSWFQQRLNIMVDAFAPKNDESNMFENLGTYNRKNNTITINLLGKSAYFECKADHESVLKHELEHAIARHDPEQARVNKAFAAEQGYPAYRLKTLGATVGPMIVGEYVTIVTSYEPATIGGIVAGILLGLVTYHKTQPSDQEYFEAYMRHPEEIRAYAAEKDDEVLMVFEHPQMTIDSMISHPPGRVRLFSPRTK